MKKQSFILVLGIALIAGLFSSCIIDFTFHYDNDIVGIYEQTRESHVYYELKEAEDEQPWVDLGYEIKTEPESGVRFFGEEVIATSRVEFKQDGTLVYSVTYNEEYLRFNYQQNKVVNGTYETGLGKKMRIHTPGDSDISCVGAYRWDDEGDLVLYNPRSIDQQTVLCLHKIN